MTRLACFCLLLWPTFACAQDDPAAAPPGRVVSVEITILEIAGQLQVSDPQRIDLEKLQQAVRDARDAGILRHLSRVRLATVERLPARVQWGETRPQVSARTQMPGRGPDGPRVATSYHNEETGTLVTVTPRIAEEGLIFLELGVEQTHLEPARAAASDDNTPLPSPKAKLELETTVGVRSGQTVLVLGCQQADGVADELQTYVTVCATALP